MSIEITYFVHGTTIDNLEKKATGWLDGELSEKGKDQCNQLKTNININEFDFIFCSDLKRAVDSANITFGNEYNVIKDIRLRECNYGNLNGKDSKLVQYEEHIKTAFPNGESLIDVQERIEDFCKYLKKEYNNKKIAIVAHKATQMAFQVITEHITWEDAIKNDWRKNKNWRPGWKYIVR